MTLNSLFSFFKSRPATPVDSFSDFFRNASVEQKKQVFTEAAKRANEDQRRTYKAGGGSLDIG